MFIEDSIVWRTRFSNSLLLSNKIWPNDTDVTLHLVPCNEDPNLQHITFEKYKYCFVKILQNSIFINNQKEHKIFKPYSNYVIDFPERPVDQMVGVCLYSKINSIGGTNLKLNALEIESWQGENIRFIITETSPEWDFLPNEPKEYYWWQDPQPNFTCFENKRSTWEEIGFNIKDSDSHLTVIQGKKNER